jgi:hypothetical protein
MASLRSLLLLGRRIVALLIFSYNIKGS